MDFDVLLHIRYNASWESARWQDDTKTWLLKLRMGRARMVIEHECKVLIPAVGRFVNPNPLKILGQDIFEGRIVYSAQ